LGSNILLYKWEVSQDYDSSMGGWFLLVEPEFYYQFYDTLYAPIDDGDIGELYERTMIEVTANDHERGKWWQEVGENTGTYTGSSVERQREIRDAISRLSSQEGAITSLFDGIES
jgi:hypothetical protein